MNYDNNKKGFTLAEVLITLGIIGVVAALTMPSLIQNYQEKVTITKLKKAYSVLQNAYISAVNDNGVPANNWADDPIEVLSKYIYLDNTPGKCIGVKSLNGVDTGRCTTKKFNDNMSISTYSYDSPDCNFCGRCGWFNIDINGESKPNVWGRDIFTFALTNKNIVPLGADNAPTCGWEQFKVGCNSSETDSGHYTNGIGCAAWVLVNENMDYLHCSGLDWNGKTKCK